MTPVDYAARDIVHFAALRPVGTLDHTLHIISRTRRCQSRATSSSSSSPLQWATKSLAAVEYSEWKPWLQQAAPKDAAPLNDEAGGEHQLV
ncbi:hypothetical protein JG687_00018581 [Phytophthora cactorum]|uniref:Uncharacterized protein n=1 Tax=Phytophthora cactorum TaxID=29920 RepID=A0A329RPZ3_9STRA|nr:hypothetical protein GQ600_24349 [Phytophthora cactorum]KAG2786252.1 hypothetical protein Pcac1_g4342 [Phytophthora cactorum]KAG2796065.1 hypothetical protein PC111_g21886 [Phytophthora cactorum]KAG2805375.1 hypothetical protein PC112_g18300 [Phytophthora cactorum]KAG2845345.1 hypothetical protein PC113_g18216 [Phytophthora cactorum]